MKCEACFDKHEWEKLEQYERLSYQDRKLNLRAMILSYQNAIVKDIHIFISFKTEEFCPSSCITLAIVTAPILNSILNKIEFKRC